MQRSFVLAAAAAATLLTAGAAHAGGVNWSIGISAPPVAAFVGDWRPYYPAPSYYAAPVYPVAPYYPPRVYAPAPRIWLPPAAAAAALLAGGRIGWRDVGWRNDGWRDDGWPATAGATTTVAAGETTTAAVRRPRRRPRLRRRRARRYIALKRGACRRLTTSLSGRPCRRSVTRPLSSRSAEAIASARTTVPRWICQKRLGSRRGSSSRSATPDQVLARRRHDADVLVGRLEVDDLVDRHHVDRVADAGLDHAQRLDRRRRLPDVAEQRAQLLDRRGEPRRAGAAARLAACRRRRACERAASALRKRAQVCARRAVSTGFST